LAKIAFFPQKATFWQKNYLNNGFRESRLVFFAEKLIKSAKNSDHNIDEVINTIQHVCTYGSKYAVHIPNYQIEA
jgi:hypothetical protein